MLITDKGTLVRFKVSELSIIGRNTQGVRLINVSSGELVVGMQKIEDLGEESEDLEDSVVQEDVSAEIEDSNDEQQDL